MSANKMFGIAISAIGALVMFLLVLIFNNLDRNSIETKQNALALAVIDTKIENIHDKVDSLESYLEEKSTLLVMNGDDDEQIPN